MVSGVLARFVETTPGRVMYRIARLPLLRPVLQAIRRRLADGRDALIRLKPVNRHHDLEQRATLRAFEAMTAGRKAVR